MGILTGVSLTSGVSVVRQIRIGRIISNMKLIQTKAEMIYEEYQFYNNDENYLVKADENTYVLATMDMNITQEEIDMIARSRRS